MSALFIVDAQLPPRLARCLVELGQQASDVLELGQDRPTDSWIWMTAKRLNAVIVTKGEDFAGLARAGADGPAVVWLRVGNVTNDALLRWFEPRWEAILQALTAGERLIEVR